MGTLERKGAAIEQFYRPSRVDVAARIPCCAGAEAVT